MKQQKNIVSICPFCSGQLRIGRLACSNCETQIETSLDIPPFFRLPEDLRHFVIAFLRCRGNIREVEKKIGVSYPTVCKKLDMVNKLLAAKTKVINAQEVLERVERGDLSAAEAAQILRGT